MKRKYRYPTLAEILPLFEQLEQGDEEAFKELLYRFSYLPQRLVRGLKWAANYDDLLNTGYAALAKSIRTFDPTKCNNFVMWSKPQIKTAIGRAKHAEKKWLEREHIDDYQDLLLVEKDLEEQLISWQLENLLGLYLHRLGRLQRLVVIKSFGLNNSEPKSLREIAQELDLSPTKVWKAKATAINQLTKMFEVHANKPTNEHEL